MAKLCVRPKQVATPDQNAIAYVPTSYLVQVRPHVSHVVLPVYNTGRYACVTRKPEGFYGPTTSTHITSKVHLCGNSQVLLRLDFSL